jgi:hypothetical protein
MAQSRAISCEVRSEEQEHFPVHLVQKRLVKGSYEVVQLELALQWRVFSGGVPKVRGKHPRWFVAKSILYCASRFLILPDFGGSVLVQFAKIHSLETNRNCRDTVGIYSKGRTPNQGPRLPAGLLRSEAATTGP